MNVTKITVDVKPFDRSLQLPATRLKRIYANGVGSIIVIMINDTWVYIAFKIKQIKKEMVIFLRHNIKLQAHSTVCEIWWTWCYACHCLYGWVDGRIFEQEVSWLKKGATDACKSEMTKTKTLEIGGLV